MKITDVSMTIFTWPGVPPVQYGHQNPVAKAESRLGLLAIETDQGVTGHSFLGASFRSVDVDAVAVMQYLKPILMGQDPLAREGLHRAMMLRTRAIMLRPIGAADVALWDLAGKLANLPIHQLLGTYRDRVPAYASSSTLAGVEEYVAQARAVKEAGYRGYKIHPPHQTAVHLPICAAVRKAVGDGFPLMLDSSMSYNYPEALRIGRGLEELDYLWFEDPLPVDDLYTYPKLCADLRIPVMATEYSPGGFHSYAQWILARATDALRGDVAIKGGITAVVKSAHLADGFQMNYELHHGGNSINNVANLQVALAIRNCDFFEVLLPAEAHKYGLVQDLEIGKDGCVQALPGPGLGVEIDFDLVARRTVEVLR